MKGRFLLLRKPSCLPDELLIQIMTFLDAPTVARTCCLISRRFYTIATKPHLWKILCLCRFFCGRRRSTSRDDLTTTPAAADQIITNVLFPLLSLDWASLYCFVHSHRVANWSEIMHSHRHRAMNCFISSGASSAIDHLSALIQLQLQSGLDGGVGFAAQRLANDLVLRAKCRQCLGNKGGEEQDGGNKIRIEEDICLAVAIDPEHHSMSTISVSLPKITDTDYFERLYDFELLSGTIGSRARFLLAAITTSSSDCFLSSAYLHLYLLCDTLNVWPKLWMDLARSHAPNKSMRRLCDAWSLYDQGDMNAALAAARDAASTSSAPLALFTLGFVAQYTDEAIAAYEKFLSSRNPEPHPARRAVTYNNLGAIYCHRKEYATALKWLEAARAINPRSFLTHKTIAKCLLERTNSHSEAYEVLTNGHVAQEHQLADMYCERSKYGTTTAQVLDDLDKASELNPRLSYPYRLRAALLMDDGDVVGAINELKASIRLSLDVNDMFLLASFQWESGEKEGAVNSVRIAGLLALLMSCCSRQQGCPDTDTMLLSSPCFEWLRQHDPLVAMHL
eukprot:PhM_4_TR13075/c0_g1_i1/m.10223